MGKREKTVTIYRLDHPEVEFAEPAAESGVIHNFTEYNQDGFPVLDIDYDSMGEMEQQTLNVWNGNLLVESKVMQADHEISEWKTFEYSEDGKNCFLKNFTIWTDLWIRLIISMMSRENYFQKTTINADDETESKTVYHYSEGLLSEEITFNEQEEIIQRQQHVYHTDGKPSESVVEIFDDGKKTA